MCPFLSNFFHFNIIILRFIHIAAHLKRLFLFLSSILWYGGSFGNPSRPWGALNSYQWYPGVTLMLRKDYFSSSRFQAKGKYNFPQLSAPDIRDPLCQELILICESNWVTHQVRAERATHNTKQPNWESQMSSPGRRYPTALTGLFHSHKLKLSVNGQQAFTEHTWTDHSCGEIRKTEKKF